MSSDVHWHQTSVEGRPAVYGDVGEGAPLVFLHGWGLTSRTYARVLPVLAAAGSRVIAPALPGFGRTADLPGTLTWDKLADWVVALLDGIGIDEPAHLVGHSFGGGVATMTAWHHRERVRSLVLVNSIGGSTWKSDDRGERTLAERPWWDWGLRAPSEWTRKGYRRIVPVVARDFMENVMRHPGNLLRAGALARDADMRTHVAELAEGGLPVTILWGDRDRMLPQAGFVSLVEAAGGGSSVVAGGHSWLIADPAGFGEALTNSLAIHELLAQPRRRRRNGSAIARTRTRRSRTGLDAAS